MSHRNLIYTNETGLILYLDAGNTDSYVGTGSNWIDIANRNTATLYGPSYSSNSGGSMVFVNTDNPPNGDYLIISASTYMNFNQHTISIWCRSPEYAALYVIFEKTINSVVYSSVNLVTTTTTFEYYTKGLTTETLYGPTTTMTNNQWNNVVLTYDGSMKRVYNNNVLKLSGSTTGTITTGNGLSIMGTYLVGGVPSTGYKFNGNISIVQIWNRALEVSEINTNWLAYKGRYGL